MNPNLPADGVILRAYDCDDLRAEISETGDNRWLRVRILVAGKAAYQATFPTLTEAEAWVRRVLNLGEVEQLVLPGALRKGGSSLL